MRGFLRTVLSLSLLKKCFLHDSYRSSEFLFLVCYYLEKNKTKIHFFFSNSLRFFFVNFLVLLVAKK